MNIEDCPARLKNGSCVSAKETQLSCEKNNCKFKQLLHKIEIAKEGLLQECETCYVYNAPNEYPLCNNEKCNIYTVLQQLEK